MTKTTTLIMCIAIFAFAIDLSIPNVMAQEACIVPTVIENAETPDGWAVSWLEWAPSNPQIIERGQTKSISVIGGRPPFIWTVSGQGFSLEKIEDRKADLRADETACGSATIDVVDSLMARVSGSLREPNNGRWVFQNCADGQCILKGTGVRTGISAHIYWAELVKGGKKQIQGTIGRGGGGCDPIYRDCTCPTLCSSYAAVQNCIEPELVIPCRIEVYPGWIQYSCTEVVYLWYYEWECN